MAQFNIDWDISDWYDIDNNIVTNTNVIDQTISYRRLTTGGAFITIGFTPNNNMGVSIHHAQSPVLLSNVVYEFNTKANCAVGGPILNDNGNVQALQFAAIDPPTLNVTDTTASITIDVTGTDITKARLILKKYSDNSTVYNTTVTKNSSNIISTSKNSLTPSTQYYWTIELFATIAGIDTISSDPDYVNSVFGPYNITTTATTVCTSPTSLTVTVTTS